MIKHFDPRTIITIVAVVVAAVSLQIGTNANHEAHQANQRAATEAQARINASCIASNQSRGEISNTFSRLTDGLLRATGKPSDLLLANEIDASVRKTVGGNSPLCKVPGVTVPSTTTTTTAR